MAREDEQSLAQLVQQLADDAREVAGAEIELQKARLLDRIGRYRAAAIFFAIAGTVAFAALIALLVGLIIAIATLVGPGLATLIVIGVALLIAAVLGLVGKARLSPSVPEPTDLAAPTVAS